MPVAKPSLPAWKPRPDEIVVITNVSQENLSFQLPTGRFRLDLGSSRLVEASFLELPDVQRLISAGKLTVTPRALTRSAGSSPIRGGSYV